MLTRQVVVISGDRITDVGPEAQVEIPAGAKLIDLSHATVLPGLIDAHTHMFNDRWPPHAKFHNAQTERRKLPC